MSIKVSELQDIGHLFIYRTTMADSYLTEENVTFILKKHYHNKSTYSEDRFVLKDKLTFTLAYIKYNLTKIDWNWDAISHDIIRRLLLKSVTSIFIR